MPDRSSSHLVRYAASAVLIVGIILAAIEAFRASSAAVDRLGIILQGVIVLAAFASMGAVLYAMAAVIDQRGASGSAARSAEIMQNLLQQINSAIEQLPANLSSISAINSEDHPSHPTSSTAQIPPELTTEIHRITALLEQIREASMMDEPQRKATQKALRERRKLATIADAASAIQGRQWGKADKLISQLEVDFPSEPAVIELHEQLAKGRKSLEGESVQKIKARVEDLMAISSWDEAYRIASQFAENFPENSEGAALLMRVTRERDLFHESTVHQLYEEIKADLDRRRWRRALAGAQRLLDRFPDHRKTAKIRAQLKTIQDNAEIEERQEQELRIQELVRSKRFAEAIELAEDLLDRFPLSPQAESLDAMLPKMRDLAFHQDIAAETASQR